MREVLFKNLTSQDAHRRHVVVSEILTQDGMIIETQRRSTYFLKNRIHVKDLSNLNNLKDQDKKHKPQKRHFRLIKKHNSRSGEDKLFCKIRGLLYAVMGNYIYLIAFTNSFKITLKKSTIVH